MVSSKINRLYIGLLVVTVVLFSYLVNLDKIFLFLLLFLISYEFFYMRITNILYLIFLSFFSLISILFVPYQLFENLFIFQLFFILGILFLEKYKKELFIISLYVFCLILFYLISIDRNIFYLLFLISFFNDTVAYISGRFFGGPLILPKISPKKTWSGTSVSFLLTTFILFLFNFNILTSMALSILLFIGDIFFSYIKRFLNIKDFSPILGSHGGILDRLDSTFLVSIFFQIHLVYLI